MQLRPTTSAPSCSIFFAASGALTLSRSLALPVQREGHHGRQLGLPDHVERDLGLAEP